MEVGGEKQNKKRAESRTEKARWRAARGKRKKTNCKNVKLRGKVELVNMVHRYEA